MALVRDEKSIGIAIGHCALGSFHQEDAIIVTFPQKTRFSVSPCPLKHMGTQPPAPRRHLKHKPQNARSFAKLRAFVTLSFRSRCLGYRRAGKQM